MVETRGIEPLTPPCKRTVRHRPDTDGAGYSDTATQRLAVLSLMAVDDSNWITSPGCRLSDVDDQDAHGHPDRRGERAGRKPANSTTPARDDRAGVGAGVVWTRRQGRISSSATPVRMSAWATWIAVELERAELRPPFLPGARHPPRPRLRPRDATRRRDRGPHHRGVVARLRAIGVRRGRMARRVRPRPLRRTACVDPGPRPSRDAAGHASQPRLHRSRRLRRGDRPCAAPDRCRAEAGDRPTTAVFPGGPRTDRGGEAAVFPGRAPEISNLPARNLAFTGRNQLLAQLRERLTDATVAAVLPVEAVTAWVGSARPVRLGVRAPVRQRLRADLVDRRGPAHHRGRRAGEARWPVGYARCCRSGRDDQSLFDACGAGNAGC